MFPQSNVTPRRKCLLQLNIMFIIYIHDVDFLCYHPTVNLFVLCGSRVHFVSREHSNKVTRTLKRFVWEQ